MATTTTSSPAKSPFEIGIDRLWRFFCSVRWAVVEIAFLALLVLIGTLRGSEVPEWIAQALPFTRGLVDVWYDWDVYRSPVFAVTLTIIAIAIAVCTLNRAPGIWQAISNPTITTSRGFLRNADTSAEFGLGDRDRDEALAGLTSSLEGKRYRVISRTIGDQTHIYADKNRYAKLGTFPFHLALILLLLGGIVASQYGFRDVEFVLAEGDTRPVGHGTDLSIKLNSFIDSYTPGAVAASYESDIVVYEDGKEVKSGVINPNNPMSHGTATIYQSSFIYAAVITVRDPYGSTIWSGPIDIGVFNMKGNEDAPAGARVIPEAGIQVVVVGQDVDPLNAPELDTLNLQSGEMWIQVQQLATTSDVRDDATSPSAVVAQNSSANLGGVNVTFERETRATVLQIANNPGIPIFAIASLMMVGGLIVVFYFPQRRIRGLVWNGPNGLTAHLAPLARRDWSGKREFIQAARDAEQRLAVTASIKQPAGTEGSPDDALQPLPSG